MEAVHYARACGMGGQSYCFERSEPTGLKNVTSNFTRAGNCPCGIANVYCVATARLLMVQLLSASKLKLTAELWLPVTVTATNRSGRVALPQFWHKATLRGLAGGFQS